MIRLTPYAERGALFDPTARLRWYARMADYGLSTNPFVETESIPGDAE